MSNLLYAQHVEPESDAIQKKMKWAKVSLSISMCRTDHSNDNKILEIVYREPFLWWPLFHPSTMVTTVDSNSVVELQP